MSISRREFLGTSAAAFGLALASPILAANWSEPVPHEGDDANIKPAEKKLKILILGGTAFTGPHLVRLALKRGHSVTVFNRGKTEKRMGSLPNEVEKLIGDRDPKDPLKLGGLKALEGDREWDAVVDTSGYVPRVVRASAELLAKRTKNYIFISSISVYKNPIKPDADEDAPLATMSNPLSEEMGAQFENYGALKVLCEKAVSEVMGQGRTAIVRPTFISGPGDPTDRFTYWPVRVSRGGEVLCPGTPKDPVQFIDVRDLAAFLLTLCENATAGTFNAAGPNPACTMQDLIVDCMQAGKTDAKPTWVDSEFLEEQGAIGWFPIWVPPQSEMAGMATINIQRGLKAGLKLRSVPDTVRATLEWWPGEVARRKRVTQELIAAAEKEGKPAPKLPDPEALRAGPGEKDEKKVLAAWATKHG